MANEDVSSVQSLQSLSVIGSLRCEQTLRSILSDHSSVGAASVCDVSALWILSGTLLMLRRRLSNGQTCNNNSHVVGLWGSASVVVSSALLSLSRALCSPLSVCPSVFVSHQLRLSDAPGRTVYGEANTAPPAELS